MGVKYGPSKDQIKQLAEEVRDAAIRVKGEKELRMCPKTGHGSEWAGQLAVDANGAMNTYQPEGKYGDYGIGEDNRYLGTTKDWATLESGYQWIPGEFERYLMPEPHDFDALVDSSQKLTKDFVNVGPAKDPANVPAGTPSSVAPGTSAVDQPIRLTMGFTSDWSGHFADGFQRYLSEIPDVTRRQAVVAETLYEAAVAARDIYGAGREELGNIAKNAKLAIEGVEAGKSTGGCAGSSMATGFALIAAAATVAAGVSTLPISGPAVISGAMAAGNWTIVVGISSAIAAGSPLIPAPEKIELLASDVDGVIEKMKEALTKREKTVTDSEEAFAKKLGDNSEMIEKNKVTGKDGGKSQENAFFPRRPAMLDMSTDLKDLKDPATGFTHPVAAS